jgi:hypothetical protein
MRIRAPMPNCHGDASLRTCFPVFVQKKAPLILTQALPDPLSAFSSKLLTTRLLLPPQSGRLYIRRALVIWAMQ